MLKGCQNYPCKLLTRKNERSLTVIISNLSALKHNVTAALAIPARWPRETWRRDVLKVRHTEQTGPPTVCAHLRSRRPNELADIEPQAFFFFFWKLNCCQDIWIWINITSTSSVGGQCEATCEDLIPKDYVLEAGTTDKCKCLCEFEV